MNTQNMTTTVRRGMNMSKTELAQKAGVSRGTIVRLENGLSADMRLSAAKRIAGVLHIAPELLDSPGICPTCGNAMLPRHSVERSDRWKPAEPVCLLCESEQ